MNPCTKEKEIDKIQTTLDNAAKLEIEKENRMTKIETLVTTIADSVEKIDKKIDKNHEQTQNLISNADITTRKYLETKADKEEVRQAQEDIKSINNGLLSTSRTASYQMVGLVITAISVIVTLIIAISK